MRFPGILAGLSGLIPEDDEEPMARCARCDLPVDLPPSEHFVTLCGGLACSPPPPTSGQLKKLPQTWRER